MISNQVQVACFSGLTLIIIFRDLEEYIDDTLPTIEKTFEIPVNEFDGACKKMRSFARSHAKLKRSTTLRSVTRKIKFCYLLTLLTYIQNAHITDLVAVNNLSIIYRNLDPGQKCNRCHSTA